MLMRELNKQDIILNNVDTINQFRVLQYLKSNLNIYEFSISLIDKDTIKVTDKEDKTAYFKYDNDTNKILFIEDEEDKNYDLNL